MSKIASDDLYKLIRSLTPSEIRYFKIFSSRHYDTDNINYIKLFNAIAAQEKYNEAKIREQFHKEKFTRYFSIAKARLYQSILRALDIYHAGSSKDAELKRKIHYAEILYKKSLYDQCAKILTSAKKMAMKYERSPALLEIYLWEKKLIEKDNYSSSTENDISKFLNEDKLIGEKIKNFNDYWNIKSRLFMILNKQGQARTKEELHKFKKIIDNTLLKTEEETFSTETKYLFNHIYSAYYFGVGDYKKCYDYLKKNIQLIENSKHIFAEEPNIYFSVLTNIIYISSRLKRFKEAFFYLKKLREVPCVFDIRKDKDMEIKIFSSTLSIEITLYNMLGDFEKSIALIPVIEDGLDKYSGRINKLREAYFCSSIAVAYFGAEKFSQALRWNNKILNDKFIREHQDIHCFAKIFNLIIHIELKNESLIPYLYRSTYRYLKQRNRSYKFEDIFMKFVEQLMKNKQKKSLNELYNSLHVELKTLEKDTLEMPVFEFFDFTSWAQSKADNRHFREIIEKKSSA